MQLKINVSTREVSIHCDRCGQEFKYTPAIGEGALSVTAAVIDVLKLRGEFCPHLEIDFSWGDMALTLREKQ